MSLQFSQGCKWTHLGVDQTDRDGDKSLSWLHGDADEWRADRGTDGEPWLTLQDGAWRGDRRKLQLIVVVCVCVCVWLCDCRCLTLWLPLIMDCVIWIATHATVWLCVIFLIKDVITWTRRGHVKVWVSVIQLFFLVQFSLGFQTVALLFCPLQNR